MATKAYIDDIGTEILIDMRESIAAATGITLNVKKPDGTEVSWTPAIYNVNFLRYITIADDLDQHGKYTIQPSLTLGDWVGYGDTVHMNVAKRYR